MKGKMKTLTPARRQWLVVFLVGLLALLVVVVAPERERSKPEEKTLPNAFVSAGTAGEGLFGTDIWGLPYAVDRNVDPVIGVGSAAETNSENNAIGIKFAAPFTGQLSTFKTYWLSNTGSPYGSASGYAGGTGGTIRIRLYEATTGGAPTGTHLDEIIFTPGLFGGCHVSPSCPTAISPAYQIRQSSAFTWPNTPTITANGLYMVTFENTDSNPTANWIRMQFGALGESAVDNPSGFSFMGLGDGWDRSRWGFAYKQGAGAWTDGASYDSATGGIYDVVPMMGFKTTDNRSFGNASWYRQNDHSNYNYCGYGGTGTTDTHCTYHAAHPLGQRFIPDKNLAVTKLYTALSPRTGGTVRLQLRQASNLSTLGTCDITTPTLDQTSASPYHAFIRSRQYSCTLPSTVNLVSGTQYDFWIAPQGASRGSVLLDGDMTNWPFSGGGPMADMPGATINGAFYDGGTIPYYDVMFGLKVSNAIGSVVTTTAPPSVPALSPETACPGAITVQAESATAVNGSVPIVGGYRVQSGVNTSVGETVTVTAGSWTLQTRYHATASATRTLYLAPGTGGAGFSTIVQSYPATSGAWQTKTESLVLAAGSSQQFSLSYEAGNSGSLDIDYFRLCPAAAPTTTTTTPASTTSTTTPPVNTTCLASIPTRGVGFSGGWTTPALPAYTTTVNVNSNGTLQGALGGTYGPGTRILLAPGEYSGIFTSAATFAGSLASPITIQGGAGVSLVGRLDLSQSPYVTVTGIEFKGKLVTISTTAGSNAVSTSSTAGLVAGMSITSAAFVPSQPYLSAEILAITSSTSFTVADNNGTPINASSSGSTSGMMSARRAIIVANANRTVNVGGRGIRITGNTFTDVGSGANGSSEGIIFADHRAKARVGGWDPAAIATATGISQNQVYTIGLYLGDSAPGTSAVGAGHAPVEYLDLTIDNNTFTRPQNAAYWVSGGYDGFTYARNLMQGASGLRGVYENEVGGKLGFGWPQWAGNHNLLVSSNTFASDIKVGPNPYLVGFKEPGVVFEYNQVNNPDSRISSRLAHAIFRGNVVHGRLLVGATDVDSNGVLDAASLVENNYVIGDYPPTDNSPNIAVTGRATSGADWDGSNQAHPNYSILGSTTATPAIIRNNAFYLTAGSGAGALTGYDYQGTAVLRPSSVQWTNNYFQKHANLGYMVSGRSGASDSPSDWYNTVDSGTWSGNRFHGHAVPDDDSGTFVPAGALAGGGVLGGLPCDATSVTTTTTTTTTGTTIPGATTTTAITTTTTRTTTTLVGVRQNCIQTLVGSTKPCPPARTTVPKRTTTTKKKATTTTLRKR